MGYSDSRIWNPFSISDRNHDFFYFWKGYNFIWKAWSSLILTFFIGLFCLRNTFIFESNINIYSPQSGRSFLKDLKKKFDQKFFRYIVLLCFQSHTKGVSNLLKLSHFHFQLYKFYHFIINWNCNFKEKFNWLFYDIDYVNRLQLNVSILRERM